MNLAFYEVPRRACPKKRSAEHSPDSRFDRVNPAIAICSLYDSLRLQLVSR